MDTRRTFLSRVAAVSAAILGSSVFSGQFPFKPTLAHAVPTGIARLDGGRLVLPPPVTEGGMPLMRALAQRKSNRKFSKEDLSDQQLSDLLWATWGVNREDGRRTAPTAFNRQDVEVLAAMSSGIWLYDGKNHHLVQKLVLDTRADFGGAPLTLVYAAKEGPLAGLHIGSLYQNAGLYCASTGLANVVKASGVNLLQDPKYFSAFGLPSGYKIMIVHSIGLPG